MFDSRSARNCDSPTLFHPKPLPISRPPFSSSYSSPAFGSSSSPTKTGSDTQQTCVSASPTPSPPSPACKPAHHLSTKHRPSKGTSKKISSTDRKHKSVQLSIEVKAERSRCSFQSLFLPLGRTLPPAPPTSPVLGHSAPNNGPQEIGTSKFNDSHLWLQDNKLRPEEEWVEHLEQPHGRMDIDA